MIKITELLTVNDIVSKL